MAKKGFARPDRWSASSEMPLAVTLKVGSRGFITTATIALAR